MAEREMAGRIGHTAQKGRREMEFEFTQIYEGKVSIQEWITAIDTVFPDVRDETLVTDSKGNYCVAMGDAPLQSVKVFGFIRKGKVTNFAVELRVNNKDVARYLR